MRALPLALTLFLVAGCGPREVVVGVDAAHHNRHALHGDFWKFHGVFRQAGGEETNYRFRDTIAPFQRSNLDELDIWVVVGARDELRPDEVDAMVGWVEDGGALWLMLDHPPFVAPVMGLAEAFGFTLYDGTAHTVDGNDLVLTGELLADHPLIDGPFGTVETLIAARGTAFAVPEEGEVVAWAPEGIQVAGMGDEELAVIATREVGAGRVLVVGETSMFNCRENSEGELRGFCVEGHEDGRVAVRNAAAWLDIAD